MTPSELVHALRLSVEIFAKSEEERLKVGLYKLNSVYS
jgi:hypothetical protein